VNVQPLVKTESNYLFLKKDENEREIKIYNLSNVKLVGENLFYPNILLYIFDDHSIVRPIEERILSLEKSSVSNSLEGISNNFHTVFSDPLFFFVYNVDNYYHFIYDSLPYLISYFHLKKTNPKLKLLISKSNSEQKEFYKFVLDMFSILGITSEDLVIAKDDVLYEKIFISSSYTHGHDSNLPPRSEVYDFFEKIKKVACRKSPKSDLPQKIYISRRTWIHNNLSNIGTNYTTRRKLMCEDDLVRRLEESGYKEVFTENLDMVEKIKLFSNAKEVIGPIGGGLANVLFSSKDTKLLVISSPTFFDVNSRFKFCFKSTNTRYYNKTKHIEPQGFKKFMRVETIDSKVGEIIDISGNNVTIKYSNESVAGWNNDCKFDQAVYLKNQLIPLDAGLNSNWTLDVEKMMEFLK
jgi:hypothetical protein